MKYRFRGQITALLAAMCRLSRRSASPIGSPSATTILASTFPRLNGWREAGFQDSFGKPGKGLFSNRTTTQGRLRENPKATPPTAAAYKRYLEKLDTQEGELEELQAKRDQLQTKEHDQQTAFEAFLASLNVE